MIVERFEIEGPVLMRPKVYNDERGCFFESYNKEVFESLCLPTDFHQDNQSISHKGVIRGLHFQLPPWEQGKLVRVISGSVIDIAVDIRRNSPTFGKHIRVELSGDSHSFLWIPPGFAHGFSVMEDNTVFIYKCTKPYHPASEKGLLWRDPELGIDWGIDIPIVSEKDGYLPLLKDLQSSF
jgi:dTDP-4-dehydrorhamnose 3,5-epimerase